MQKNPLFHLYKAVALIVSEISQHILNWNT